MHEDKIAKNLLLKRSCYDCFYYYGFKEGIILLYSEEKRFCGFKTKYPPEKTCENWFPKKRIEND